jgi:8-oxo-dGTP pyrophosphatase MutT (NUDIX family)
MKRPDYDGAHGGQVSIPGGQLEPGKDHRQAALREFEEETGVRVDSRQLLGGLSELFIPTSNFLVRPFVAYAKERPRFRPAPEEVEEILELMIPALISDVKVRYGRARLATGARVETPFFDVDGHMVWGATAMILSELREVLRDLG